MTPHSHHAVTSSECGVCGGPCREPVRFREVHDNYPFMSADAIEATKQRHPTNHQPAPRGRRMRHVEDRAIHPGENR